MKYRKEIDGLRAVAVVPVVFFHAGSSLFAGGYVGVDVFFVISGYLITSIILNDLSKDKFSFITFYERRARRILPPLYLVILCCIPFAWLYLNPFDYKDFSQSLFAVSFYISNVLFWVESDYFAAATELKPLIHTWSLAVEEQFYILFPLLLWLLWKVGSKISRCVYAIALVGIFSLVLAQYAAFKYPEANFFLLPSRAWELAIGALIAFLFFHRMDIINSITSRRLLNEAMGTSGLVLIFYSVFTYDNTTPFPSLYALAPTLGTALLILSNSETLAGKVLSAKPTVFIGLLSYSIYLWHQPLFAFMRHYSIEEPSVGVMVFLSVLSVLLAYFSWRYVERPFRDKAVTSRKTIFIFSLAGIVFFAAIGVGGHMQNGFSSRFPEMKAIYSLVEKSKKSGRICKTSLAKARGIEGACLIGNEEAQPAFIAFGDSHTQTLAGPLGDYAKSLSIAGLNYTEEGCRGLALTSKDIRTESVELCSDLKKSFYSQLDTDLIPEYVVMGSRWTLMLERDLFDNMEGGVEFGKESTFVNEYTESLGYKKAIEKDLKYSIDKILDSGRKVILVYPVPEMGWSIPELLQKMSARELPWDDTSFATRYDVFLERNRDTYEALDNIGEHENLIRVYPEKFFCNTFAEDRCAAVRDGMPLYFDDDHLSYTGASILAKEIIDIIAKHRSDSL